MIKVDISDKKDEIKRNHKSNFGDHYCKIIDELECLKKYKNFYSYFCSNNVIDEKNIENLICADSKNKLIKVIYYIERLIKLDSHEQKTNVKIIKKDIEEVFTTLFDNFSNRNWAYQFLKLINCNVCPYCNRTYTFTIKNKKLKSKPELDHYFPKSIYPYLAISIFNIVPACSSCNKGKSSKYVRKGKQYICYPYEEGFDFTDNKINFTSDFDDIRALFNNEKKLVVKLDCENLNDKSKELIDNYNLAFKIDYLYEQHSDYFRELIQKAMIFDDNFFESIYSSVPEIFQSYAEVKQAIFSNYLEVKDSGKRSLAKATQDILDEYYNS